MTVEGYIQAMPKADLNVSFEGAVRKAAWEFLADQNEISSEKAYASLVSQLTEPDYSRLDALIHELASWVRYPDDLSRLVYDMGVALSKQNVKYAEVNVNPALYTQGNMSFEAFMEALDDGRDRAERGWDIVMRWLVSVSREEPRRADETVRWAAGTAGSKYGIVGFNLVGQEDAQPIGQFERAFQTANRKMVPAVVRAGEILGADGIRAVLDQVEITRLVDGWGINDAPDLVQHLVDQAIPLVATPTRGVKLGIIGSYEDYPWQALFDSGIALTLSADMPELLHSNLSDVYLAAIEQGGLMTEQLDDLALNALRFSLLPADVKASMLQEFEDTYSALRTEHLASTSESG